MDTIQEPPAVDARYFAIRHGDMPFEFPRYTTLEAWERRAAWLREHLLTVMGLWPMPERPPVQAHITGSLEYDDYAIDKVYLESWPGFYCTGNLYRPRGKQGPYPAILNPHGHWTRGRLEHQELGSIRARCITFARMGMMAFAYDMVGYNDSLQVPAHHFSTRQGALWGLTPLALQTWNSLRVVDWLAGLAEVDPERIGCTGASGGGTQTFMLTALEPRVQVVAPVNMISAHFQGGCVCENAPGLRTQTFNVEIGALAAPRPLLLVSATGDWTVNTPKVEYPAILSVYALYEAEDRLAWAQVDAPHNYNAESRDHVYRWFARWFLGDEELGRNAEREFVVEPDERMRVFPTGQLPTGTPVRLELERAFVDAAQRRLEALMPETVQELDHLREVTHTRLEHILEAQWPESAGEGCRIQAWLGAPTKGSGGVEYPLILGRAGIGDRVAGTLYLPPGESPQGWVLLVHGVGRIGVQDAFGEPGETVRALRDANYGVAVIDPFFVGEIPADAPARRDGDWFWATFHAPLLGERVQDILTAMSYLAGRGGQRPLTLVGLGGAAPWVLLAAALAPCRCQVCLDWGGMNPLEDGTYLGDLFAPLLRAYGDLHVAGALLAPRRCLFGNTANRFPMDWVERAYRLVHRVDQLSHTSNAVDTTTLLSWLGAGKEQM